MIFHLREARNPFLDIRSVRGPEELENTVPGNYAEHMRACNQVLRPTHLHNHLVRRKHVRRTSKSNDWRN